MSLFTCRMKIARNTGINFLSNAAPLAVAIFIMPVLFNSLGAESFGVLHFAWMVVGCFSLFDLGLGRVLTKFVAKKLGEKKMEDIPGILWTSQALLIMMGLLMTLGMALLSPFLVKKALDVPADLQTETLYVFYLISLSIPLVISTAGLRGILEGQNRFGITSTVRACIGMFSFLGPYLVLFFTKSLFVITGVLMGGRIVGWLIHLIFCFKVMPMLKWNVTFQRQAMRPLVSFGGWMIIANIINLVITYFDRFLVAAIISVAAVTYYATPYGMVTNLFIISGSVVKVIFPALAASFVFNSLCSKQLFEKGIRYVFLAMFPIILVIITFAEEGLTLWLGRIFAENSTHVLKWLAAGVLINSLLQVPSALIQSAGRPDLTAKLNLYEFPLYFILLWAMVNNHGIYGAAFAWFLRQAVDYLIIFTMANRFLQKKMSFIKDIASPFIVLLCYLAFAASITNLVSKMLFIGLTLILLSVIAWFFMLDVEDRIALWYRVQSIRSGLINSYVFRTITKVFVSKS